MKIFVEMFLQDYAFLLLLHLIQFKRKNKEEILYEKTDF